MYMPKTARFTARDPLLIGPGSASLQSSTVYVYARNSPILFVDINGLTTTPVPPPPPVQSDWEVTVTVVQGPTKKSSCGAAEMKWRWGLRPRPGAIPPMTPANGWILQRVQVTAEIRDCNGKLVSPKNMHGIEYTEGWQVEDGEVYIGEAEIGWPHQADTATTDDEGMCRKGTITQTGNVKFISGYNLTSPPWDDPDAPTPPAGGLPSLMGTPPGWTDAGSQTRMLSVRFDCFMCPPMKPILIGKP